MSLGQIARLFVVTIAAVALAACASQAATTAPTAAVSPTAAPTLAATDAASPTAPGPIVFSSQLYPYTITFAADETLGPPTPATKAWDGAERIDNGDAHTDYVVLANGLTFFVYGTRTTSSLADLAALVQQQVVAWHACPTTPDKVVETTVGGASARLHVMTCQGTLVLKLITVHDGFGLVVNQLGGSDATVEQAAFLGRVAKIAWR